MNPDGTPGPAPAAGVSIVLVDFAGGPELTGGLAADLVNRSLWRTGFGIDTVGPALATDPGLRVELPSTDAYADGTGIDTHVYLIEAPVPAPIVLAGRLPTQGFAGTVEIEPFGEDSIPVTVTGTEPVLPRIGRVGAYVNLDYALRLTNGSGVLAVSEVWLRADTPARAVTALRAAGLTFSSDTTMAAAQARYRDQGPEAGRRFALLGAGIGEALAAIALLLVAAVEREPRSLEMAALRRQGVSRRTIRTAVLAGYLWLAGSALVVGLVAVAVNLVIGGGGMTAGTWWRSSHRVTVRPGCRLISLGLTASNQVGFAATITVHEMRVLAPVPAVLPLGLSDVTRWRAPDRNGGVTRPDLTAGADGLTVRVQDTGPGVGLRITPLVTPYPLPVVATTIPSRHQLGTVDGSSQPALIAGRVPALPRVGRNGALVDLVYADQLADSNLDAVSPEVWLATTAPPGVIEALSSAGLVVTGERKAPTESRYLDRQGPAVGTRFNLLAGLAALLLTIAGMALMAAVDRRVRTEEFRALRVAGLPMPVVWRACLVGHVGLVVLACVTGCLAAFAAWLLTAYRVPLFADGQEVIARKPVPDWWRWSARAWLPA